MKLVLGRQNPTFSVTAIQLRADITYSKATVSVVIDERGLNKYARDYVSEVDQLTVAFGKGLFDYPAAADTITSAALEKPFTDDYTADDVVRVSVGYIRAYAESITSSDQIQALIAAKIITELVSVTETHVFTLSKSLADVVVVIDNADANNGDGLEYTDLMPSSDDVGTTDTATAALEKQLADAVGLLDALQNELAKVLTDAVGVTELVALALGRPLVDTVNTAESFSRFFEAYRTQSDSTLTTDLLASIGVEKLLTDAAAAVSSGSLRMTDYVDITYLAEDYVGTSTTFS